jgi:hypothetical protein
MDFIDAIQLASMDGKPEEAVALATKIMGTMTQALTGTKAPLIEFRCEIIPDFPQSVASEAKFAFAQSVNTRECHLSFNGPEGTINLRIDLRDAQTMLENLERVVEKLKLYNPTFGM